MASSSSAGGDVAVASSKAVETLVFRTVKRARDLYVGDHEAQVSVHEPSHEAALSCKISDEYDAVKHLPPPAALAKKTKAPEAINVEKKESKLAKSDFDLNASLTDTSKGATSTSTLALALRASSSAEGVQDKTAGSGLTLATLSQAPRVPKPQWHPQWKLYRVISGHTGWVKCIAVDPTNEWFATGSADRTIKIWDLASGTLRLSLTGHVSTVRGVAISARHPYLFSVAEDKSVKCWDLEQNKVVRSYHGHLSSVSSVSLHPTLDVLVTAGRDLAVRVWDMRTKAQVHCLQGHSDTVASLLTQATDPQIISGSHDKTIKLWDLAAGKCMATLTNHKKSVRALALHPKEYTFASGAPDNIKQWYLPEGKFIQNLSGHNAVINSIAISGDGVLASGADNGSIKFWDYKTGTCFQSAETIPQPGSLDAESGIFEMTFDKSFSRLLTAEADKTIKIYREDPDSTEETHPVQWNPEIWRKARF